MKRITIVLILLANTYFNGFAQISAIKITKDTTINRYRTKDSLLMFDISNVPTLVFTIKTFKSNEKTTIQKIFGRLSVRQSFQSINEKSKDAFLNLVYPKDSLSSQNFSFAFGVNVLSNRAVATLQPFIEWQRNTLISKKQNSFLAGLAFQSPLWSTIDHSNGLTLFLVSTANYKNDNVKSTKGSQISAYLTPVFNGKTEKFYFLPDANMKNDAIKINYNLYAGLEFEDRTKVLVEEHKGNVWRGYFRVTGTICPLPDVLDERLELVPDFIYRNSFSKQTLAEEKINRLWKLSINFVLIKKSASGFADVKIGFDHIKGTDPTVGFDKQQINTVTLKVKI